jgi:hypothetical protein
MRRRYGASAICALAALLFAAPVTAQERFAVIVSGVSGGEVYAAQHQTWRQGLAEAFERTFMLPTANIVTLSAEDEGATKSTSTNVKAVFADLKRRAMRDDVVFVVLLGHGTFDGDDAKFNLVGPDLTAQEWKQLLAPLPGRTVIVNTTSSSFPFLEQMSQQRRVVITATDTVAQKFATAFPEHLIRALRDAAATDADKDGRVSVWEAFAAASAGVKRHYEQKGQLSTERPLLDDDGDRVGREAEAPGGDGAVARKIYLDGDRPLTSANQTLAALERERRTLETDIEALKVRKTTMADEEYRAELERLLLRLARVDRQIRQGS